MLALEAVLAQLSMFERLRLDEVGRVAQRFAVETLADGKTRSFDATRDSARMVVVLSGRVAIDVDSPAGSLHSELEPGIATATSRCSPERSTPCGPVRSRATP